LRGLGVWKIWFSAHCWGWWWWQRYTFRL